MDQTFISLGLSNCGLWKTSNFFKGMERAVEGGGAVRLSRAKIKSVKKGSPALMVNVNKGREGGQFGGNFDDILHERSINK